MFERDQLELIDASLIVKGFLNHSYFGERLLLSDLDQLVNGGSGLPRFGRHPVCGTDGTVKHCQFGA